MAKIPRQGGLAVALLLTAVFLPAADQSFFFQFKLVDKTGGDIRHLFVSPAEADSWVRDILGGTLVKDGGEVSLQFGVQELSELWDLKVDSSEKALVWEDLPLSEIHRLALIVEDDMAVAEIE